MVVLSEATVTLRPKEGSLKRNDEISKSLGVQALNPSMRDVSIHCKEGKIVHGNKMLLSYVSPFLKSLFNSTSDWSSYYNIQYDLLCPDFDPDAMERIIELLYHGETTLRERDLSSMFYITNSLKMDIPMPDPRVTQKKNYQNVSNNNGDMMPQSKIKSEYQPSADQEPILQVCSICGMCLENTAELESHSAIHFTQKEISEMKKMIPFKLYQCSQCLERFLSLSDLANHEAIHNEPMIDQVEKPKDQTNIFPPLSSSWKSDLTNHEIVLKESKVEKPKGPTNPHNFKCNKCSKPFQFSIGLVRHMRKYHQKSSTQQKAQKKHAKSVTGTSQSNKRRGRPYKTTGAPSKTLSLEAKLETRCARYESKKDVSKKGFQCDKCPATQGMFVNLQVHYLFVHFKDVYQQYKNPNHECKLCGRIFKQSANYAGHLVAHHNILGKFMPTKEELAINPVNK